MKKISIKTVFNIILIIIFSLVITMPLIFVNKDSSKISILENKKLAQFPNLFREGNLNYKFISEFEQFINDNIGFKSDAIICDIVSNYKIFDKLKVPNYFKGEDGHLFYGTEDYNIPIYQGRIFLTDEELKICEESLFNAQRYFENTGAKFIMMTIPDKDNVYPEFYPNTINRFSDKTRLDLLTDYLKANKKINIFGVKNALIENKKNDLLYYKSYDPTHWNMNGAYIGYQELMKKIRGQMSDINMLNKQDFDITIVPSKGSLAHLDKYESINKVMKLEDYIYSYTLKGGYNSTFTQTPPPGITLDVTNDFYHYTNNKNKEFPKLLIVGDSYIYSFILPMLSESFSEVYFTRYSNSEEIQNLQEKIRADVVIYEVAERAFNINQIIDMKNLVSYNEYLRYKDLPTQQYNPMFTVDIPKLIDGSIQVNANMPIQTIQGWTVDAYAKDLVGDLYAKVEDKYYKAKFYERPDLTKVDPKYLNAGYEFNIPTIELIKSGKVSFVIIGNGKEYQYQSIDIPINVTMNKNTFIYKDLDTIDVEPFIAIDSHKIIGNRIDISDDEDIQKILGWSVDRYAEDLVGDLYAKVGEQYYKAKYYERPDLTTVNSKYLNAGYEFNIPTNELLESGKIEFVIIGNNKDYKYKPVKYKVQ